MRAKNKTIQVLLAAGALLIIAAVSYGLPGDTEAMPVRILFENKGGKVVFSHLAHHRDYRIECAQCHHERPQTEVEADGKALACGSCHPQEFNEDFIAGHIESFPNKSYCIRCHHVEYGTVRFDHDAHTEYAGDCHDCHHGEAIEPEPQKCANCHEEKASGDIPGMREAGHKQCATCHEDMFDQRLTSCKECHEPVDMTRYDGDYSQCADCHQSQARELVLPRMNAFHDQCSSCHESMGAGPSGPDACNRCHVTK